MTPLFPVMSRRRIITASMTSLRDIRGASLSLLFLARVAIACLPRDGQCKLNWVIIGCYYYFAVHVRGLLYPLSVSVTIYYFVNVIV